MMILLEILLLLYLTSMSVVVITRTHRLIKAINLQRFISRSTNNCNTSIGFIGCSVICFRADSLKQIERLLTCDYYKYEVILSLNSTHQRELFNAIVKHYKLIKVNNSCPEEIATSPILALYRSRKRCFRRLVIVDSTATNEYDALNVALNISSFDYIIPASYSSYLHPTAITTVAITLSETEHQPPELIYCDTATPCYIFQRNALIDYGGFSEDIIKRYPKAAIHHIYFSLMQRTSTTDLNDKLTLSILLVIYCAALLLCSLCLSPMLALCIIATTAIVISAARYIIYMGEEKNCSVKAMLYQISNLTTFFRSRKFTIS